MRLIDADKFFNDMYNMCNTKAQFVMNFGEIVNVVDVLEQIMNTPTIDAVKVVRCKDCIFYRTHFAESVQGFCHNHGSIVGANAFCSYGSHGKHREDGEA